MTPKVKAAYLVVKYMSKVVSKQVAKECALVAVDEIKNNCYEVHKPFWKEVKQEIEKL
jgi:hypothetical protein